MYYQSYWFLLHVLTTQEITVSYLQAVDVPNPPPVPPGGLPVDPGDDEYGAAGGKRKRKRKKKTKRLRKKRMVTKRNK